MSRFKRTRNHSEISVSSGDSVEAAPEVVNGVVIGTEDPPRPGLRELDAVAESEFPEVTMLKDFFSAICKIS